MIKIDPTYLTESETNQAHYLSSLGRFRAMSIVLAARITASGSVDLNEYNALQAEVEQYAPLPEFRPLREVAEITGIAQSTLRKWCLTGDVAAEQRYGKLWYLDPGDARRVAIEQGAMTRPGRKAKLRS